MITTALKRRDHQRVRVLPIRTLRTIELCHNSRLLTGNKDSLKREKPFFNVTKFRVNIAIRATDIDTNNVDIFNETGGGYVQSWLLNLKNRNWMKLPFFGAWAGIVAAVAFLNTSVSSTNAVQQ